MKTGCNSSIDRSDNDKSEYIPHSKLDKVLQSIALFMAVLVISIPFCISSAEASLIQQITVQDENEIEGMVKSDDGTMFVDVVLDHEITPEEIFYQTDTGFFGEINSNFEYCEGTTCIYQHPIIGKKDGKYTATIRVDTIDTDEHETKTVEFCADSVSPTVTVDSVKQLKQSVEIAYTAQDNANENQNCNPGLKEATLYINDVPVKTKEFTDNKPIQKGAFTLANSDVMSYVDEGMSSDSSESVEFDVRVEAKDKLGNLGTSETKAKKLDSGNPEFLSDTLRITDTEGLLIEVVAGADEQGVMVTPININLDIKEEDLSISGTYADLSDVTLNGQDTQVKPTCTPENTVDGKINHCVWKDISYDGKAYGNVKFTATDNVGNKATLERTLPLKKHSGKPVINNIYVIGQEDAAKIYVKKTFDLGITVSDPAGFNKTKNLKLSLSNIQGSITPSECKETIENTWDCFYNNLKAESSKTKGKIGIKSDSTNDLGQKVDLDASVMTELEVNFDSEAPDPVKFMSDVTIDDIQYEKDKPFIISSSDCPTYQESLDLTILVKDINKPQVIVDSSPISSNGITKGECSEVDDLSAYEGIDIENEIAVADYNVAKAAGYPIIYECTVSISNIIPATSKSPIPYSINVTDPAGNTLKLEHETKLCAFNPSAVPDCVSDITIENVPKIYKTTLEKTEVIVPVKLNYEIKGCSGLTILNQQFECNGVEFQFLNGERIEAATGANEKDVLLVMKKQAISQNDPYNFDPVTGESGDTNTYNVNCKTTMSLRFKELYYQVPEEQEFSFSVPLEGFILGEPSDGMREVIKQLDEEIDEQKELGNKWLTVIETIEFLCQIAKFANDINAVLQAIKSVSYWVLLVVKNSYPAASAGAVSTWISMCTVLDEINYVFTEFFWPTATLPVPPKVGHLFKWLCLYMECKLAEPNTYAMLLGEGISLGINAAAKEMYSNKEGNKLDEQTYVEEQTSSVSATDTLEGTSVTYSQIQEPGVYGCTESSCSSLTNVGSESSGMGSNVGIHASEDSAVILYKDKAVEVDLSTQKTGTMKVTTYSSEKLSDKTSGYWGVFSDAGSSPGSTAQFMPPNVNGIIGRETKTGIGLGGYIMWDEDALGMSNTPNKVVDEAKYKAWTTQNVDDLKKNLDEAWLDGSAFNPYKIEALDWACPRAARLAALKTQQIKCAQKLCYFNAIKYGTNPELCDTAYAIHKCLYVDGAITYAVDIWDAWWASLGKQMLYNLIYQAILNLPVQLACYPYYTPGGVGADQYCMQPMETGGAMSAICGTTMTVLSIMEAGYALSSMNDDEYWNWWKTIETGANYCEQAKNAAEEMNI